MLARYNADHITWWVTILIDNCVVIIRLCWFCIHDTLYCLPVTEALKVILVTLLHWHVALLIWSHIDISYIWAIGWHVMYNCARAICAVADVHILGCYLVLSICGCGEPVPVCHSLSTSYTVVICDTTSKLILVCVISGILAVYLDASLILIYIVCWKCTNSELSSLWNCELYCLCRCKSYWITVASVGCKCVWHSLRDIVICSISNRIICHWHHISIVEQSCILCPGAIWPLPGLYKLCMSVHIVRRHNLTCDGIVNVFLPIFFVAIYSVITCTCYICDTVYAVWLLWIVCDYEIYRSHICLLVTALLICWQTVCTRLKLKGILAAIRLSNFNLIALWISQSHVRSRIIHGYRYCISLVAPDLLLNCLNLICSCSEICHDRLNLFT